MSGIVWIFVVLSVFGCKSDSEREQHEPTVDAPTWFASLEELDGEGMLQLRLPGTDTFQPWRTSQPLPAPALLRTPATARATIAFDEVVATLDQSTTVELLTPTVLDLRSGRALVTNPTDHHVQLKLPHGTASIGRGKVVVAVGSQQTILTVTRGELVAGEANAVAGDQVTLRDGRARVAPSPDLGAALSWATIQEATDELPDVPRGLGKLVGKTPGEEREHRLDLIDHKVDVTIRGNLAYTEITESFRNPVNQTLEGVYRFPMPPDARINRLALKVGDNWMEGEFLATARAEQIWRDVITQWRDPAMLKWKEGNTFELRIFPIDPRQTRVVKIGYVQRLEPSSNGYSYTYPMPVDRAGLIPAQRFEVTGKLYGHDATQSLEMLGYPGTIETGATPQDEAVATFRYAEDDFVARGDLTLQFGRRDIDGLRTFTHTSKRGEQHTLFVVRPDLARTQGAANPRDFVVIIDRSYNRSGAALALQKRLVPKMIEEMDPRDRVIVLACNQQCEAVGSPELRAGGVSTAHDVEAALVGLDARGGTYPVEAVRVAAEVFRAREGSARDAHVVYFTDGVASIGELRPAPMAAAVRATLAPFSAQLSVVDLGGEADNLTLAALARAGAGRVVKVDPMLSPAGQALQLLSAHYRTTLTNPQVTLSQGVVAGNLPAAIGSGDELVIAATTSATTGELVLTGEVGGEPKRFTYPFTLRPTSDNSFVPGEWAAQRIAALELEEEGDHVKEIVKLSTTYGVLSRYTTLLALESKEMMREFNVTQRQRTTWRGEASIDESAEPVEPVERPAATAKKKRPPSREPSSLSASSSVPRTSIDFFGGGGYVTPRAPLPQQRRRLSQRAPSWQLREAAATTDAERSTADRAVKALERDETNRTRRMSAIRALIRANDARSMRLVKAWLDLNPMDPEAVVQHAQLLAFGGDIDAFYDRLISAADAAPRGRWLQERIARAASAQGDEALLCAMNVALESTARKPPTVPSDILACPLATDLRTWRGERVPRVEPAAQPVANGALQVTLASTGGDWDVMLLEASGRPLWWGSARRDLKFGNVTGGVEWLALPHLGAAPYSIYAIPRTGRAGDRLTAVVKVHGVEQTFRITVPAAAPVEIAEVNRTRARY